MQERSRRGLPALVLFAMLIAFSSVSMAQIDDPNECDVAGETPDVIVGDMPAVQRYGTLNDFTSFSVATTSCNVGTCWLEWFSNINRHPVIGQSVYRLMDGRLEQVGQGWLKHGFFALSETLCSDDCESTNGTHLGVNCSDPYSAGLNGLQGGLGPKFQVNPHTGEYPYPFFAQDQTGDTLYKRIRVHNDDLDPGLNPGARYFVEGIYITPDDAAAGKGDNNASHREVTLLGSPGTGFYDLDTIPGVETVQSRSAIFGWLFADLTLKIKAHRVPNEGLIWTAAQAYDRGNGVWEYEYAVQNLNSHRGIESFRVPLPVGANAFDIGFHDADYHSGEVQDGTDWAVTYENSPNAENYIEWRTESFGDNPNANAIHWGTLYNFRFKASAPPTDETPVTLGYFRPGTPDSGVITNHRGPQICDNDGVCEFGEDCDSCPGDCSSGGGDCCGDNVCEPGVEDSCSCAQDCGAPALFEAVCDDSIDDDCDGATDCQDVDCCGIAGCGSGPDGDGDGFDSCSDCDDNNDQVWNQPGEVVGVVADETGSTLISWDAPVDFGGTGIGYAALRSSSSTDFINGAVCMTTAGQSTTEAAVPAPGEVWYVLVYATNGCPDGKGTAGNGSSGAVRSTIDCP